MAAGKFANILLRLIQFLFVAILLGLSGALLQQQLRGGTPTRLNYAMYAVAFAALTHIYLLPAAFVDKIRSPVVTTILDILNFIFLICSGIAMAAQLGGHSCTDRSWLRTNGITNGGGYGSPTQRCGEAKALTAFLWFTAFLFLASLMFSAFEIKNRGTSASLNRKRPNMNQV